MSKITKKIFFLISFIALTLSLSSGLNIVKKVSAEGEPEGFQTLNLAATDKFATLTTVTAPNIVSGGLTLVLILTTVVFFFILVMGGISWITSGGDEKKVTAARAKITNALIGLAIVFASWAIISLISTLFGINLLTLTIKEIGT